MSNNNVKKNVGSFTIEELFKLKLNIPKYQRPYAWEQEQVITLIEDLIEAFDRKKDKYLIGNMIFFYTKKKNVDELHYEIVDGQQRITTLSLILKVLEYNNLEFLENEEFNPLSFKTITNNYKIINNKLKYYTKNKDSFKKFILNNVIITFINAKDLDEAFMLFDSQNTRGKPLTRTDLLKVHHIRFIEEYDKQKQAAKKWEVITKNKQNEYSIEFVLNNLMLIRKAVRGEITGDDLVYLDLFKEFKAEDDYHFLNNYNQPPIFEDFNYDIDNNQLILQSKSFDLKGLFRIDNGLEFLPFEIIQSIEGGERFFWFVMKYNTLINNLSSNTKVFHLLDKLEGNGNIFLRKIYQSCLIFFVDKFGHEKIEDFAIRVFVLLFYKRYIKTQIRKEAVVKFNWNDENTFDIYKTILIKYSSSLVIKEMDKYIEFNIGEIDFSKIVGTKKIFWKAFSSHEDKVKKIIGVKECQEKKL